MFFGEIPRFWRLAPLLLLGSLALAWPAFLNGDAFYLADTTAYARGADASVYRVTGRSTQWTDVFKVREKSAVATAADGVSPAATADHPADQAPVVLAGRSIYYGFLLYVSTLIGGFGLAIAVQALCAAVCAMLTVRNIRVALGRERTVPNPLLLLPALAVLTPLAYFVSYMVPDLAIGISVLAVANLIILGPDLSRRQRVFLFVTLCVGLLVHSANLLIIGLLLLAIALAAAVRVYPIRWRQMFLPVLALIIAVSGEGLFSASVEGMTGAPPIRPPFLTARLIADGPGRNYLAANCQDKKFLLCEWRDRLPDASDAFLWDGSPNARGFTAASDPEKRRLAKEETSFVLAVIRHDPIGVAGTTARAIMSQASMVGLPEFNYGDIGREFFDRKVPPALFEKMRRSLAYRDAMPEQPVALLSLVTFLSAIVGFGVLVARSGNRPVPWRGKAMFALVLVAIGIDVAVCGALSTPHDRYLMRILWIVPLVAFSFLPDAKPTLARRRPL